MSKFLPRDTSGLSEVRLRPQEEASSPLSLFTVPVPDKLITGCTEAVFQPFNSLTLDSNQVNFVVPAFSKSYVKLDSVKLYGSARILEIDQTNGGLKKPASSVDISVVNSLPTSIWNRVSVKFNGENL
jgi:hypothetical protein